MPVYISIIIASITISLLSLASGIFLIKKNIISDRLIHYLVGFAAGVMLSAVFLDLLPEAAEEGDIHSIFLFVLFGIIISFFMERFLVWYHHHEGGHGIDPSVFLILFGDGIHNFIDGMAIAAAFTANPALGIGITVAIAAHEIPQEIGDLSILVHGGLSTKKALFLNFFSACTALLGAILGIFFIKIFKNMLPFVLALTAGMFIYIACSDLIPDLHKDFKKQYGWKQFIPFLGGLVLMWIVLRILFPH